MTSPNTHLLVIGSGIAGLYGSLLAANAGIRVTLLSKGDLFASNTNFAQGGICAVLGPHEAAPGDSVEAHISDTLAAGAGHCDVAAVQALCREAVGDIRQLEAYGVSFDRDLGTDKRALGLEGAHSAARILHAGGDATGARIAEALVQAVSNAAALGAIQVLEQTFVSELVVEDGTVTGAEVIDAAGRNLSLAADAVLLASGGAGQLYAATTNPEVATGDGVALAYRAGATLGDLEFVQFHPTALVGEGNFLISEAVRGAGAVLRDSLGTAFMKQYHPAADLAPRDVVSRSIVAHLRQLGAKADETVFLDATGIEKIHGEGYLAKRFPTIDFTTKQRGYDWASQLLPVTPAAHYWMGGVCSDLSGRTSVPGLYVAGEVACTGVHGANRLASNSLLEGLIFSRRAVADIARSGSTSKGSAVATGQELELDVASLSSKVPTEQSAPLEAKEQLQQLMSQYAGVVRNARGLELAAQQLSQWMSTWTESTASTRETTGSEGSIYRAELFNMLQISQLLVAAAQQRQSSLGAHFRSDFTQAPVNASERIVMRAASNRLTAVSNSAASFSPASLSSASLSSSSQLVESELS